MALELGVFFVSASLLMFEVLLTRLLSVVTAYHFAFFVVSVVMFGITLGALAVYFRPEPFSRERLPRTLLDAALLYAGSVPLSLLLFLSVPFLPSASGVGIFSTVLVFAALAVPFFLHGILICVCLTRFPDRVSRLYGFDLLGGALGAFLIFPALELMDGPSAVLFSALLGGLGALAFARHFRRPERPAAALALGLAGLCGLNLWTGSIAIEWIGGKRETALLQTWNPFSRVAVYPMTTGKWPKSSWGGVASNYKPVHDISEIPVLIDAFSETFFTRFTGDFSQVSHVRWDVASLAHWLRKDASVFIMGYGGGRDVLAALSFGQKRIVGADINGNIHRLMTGPYAEFTGGLHRYPQVDLRVGDARAVLAGMDEKFDIVQASYIATWSATASGAFVLTENSLYTVEAWSGFLDKLKPNGLLSFTRLFYQDLPAQLMRLAVLASETLRRRGAADPWKHIVVARTDGDQGFPMATILVSPEPFSKADIAALKTIAERDHYHLVYTPGFGEDRRFFDLIRGSNDPALLAAQPLDLSAPTDRRPFFFHMLRLRDAFKARGKMYQEQAFLAGAVSSLAALLIVVTLGGLAIAAVPFLAGKTPQGSGPWMAYFLGIGLGFILVEIALIGRIGLFLGHPTYGVSVVLASMLLSTGLGSLASRRAGLGVAGAIAAALAILTLYLLVSERVFLALEGAPLAARLGASLAILCPIGFFMGFPFPLGMSRALAEDAARAPWLWALNGAGSVVASVAAVCLSISLGSDATVLAGMACYAVVAAVAMLRLSK